MEKTIASLYEIREELGSGGGGTVYLGYHKHLKKMIVLKADKRSLTASTDRLRQEVDMLKDLHHMYLPQVYDFVQQDGTVYTVMDYIEGESLDKPLERGEHFEQPQVIEWACELLEALCYLHSRGEHGILHADIKPANIMLTDDNEIRLIDFNIALALGEDGAVRIGYSAGYASPEHYGLDYTRPKKAVGPSDETETLREAKSTVGLSGSSSSYGRGVLLDVRSDIYSLGATLYHMLTGERPDSDATKVRHVSDWTSVNPQLAAIIDKAMNPNPNLRFQSAAEMLWAFEHLHENDVRTKKHNRSAVCAAVITVLIIVAGAVTTFIGQTQLKRISDAIAYSEQSASSLRNGDVNLALANAMKALPNPHSLLNPPYTAQAQRALSNALGVYTLEDGYQLYRRISLAQESTDSADMTSSGRCAKVELSPDGAKAAALVNEQGDYWVKLYDTQTGSLLNQLAAEKSILSEFVFLNNETILFAGIDGLLSYSLAQGKTVWGPKEHTTRIALSGNKQVVATINRDAEEAYVYNAQTGNLIRAISFPGKSMNVVSNDAFLNRTDSLFALDGVGRYLAVSFSDGGLRIFDTMDEAEDMELFPQSEYVHFEGGFMGSYFALSTLGTDSSVFVIFDLNTMEQKQFFMDSRPFHVQANENGILVSLGRTVTEHHPETGEETPVAFTNGKDVLSFFRTDAGTLVRTDENELQLYDNNARLFTSFEDEERIDFFNMAGNYLLTGNRDESSLLLRKMQKHPESQMFSYPPSISHLEARVHTDRETAMLFGLDSFSILDRTGAVLYSGYIPESEQIYDQQYRRNQNGEYLEVIYNDGMRRTWSAKTGENLAETQGEAPDRVTFYEEFVTEDYLVTHPHHGTPLVYDLHSGKLLGELENRDGLTYVTQIDDNLIAEYVTKELEHYGTLVNKKCEVLADFPNLCDIMPDGTLIFDDTRGNLRQSRLYPIDELITLAESRLESKEETV